jgi:hypothetical protein
VECLKRHSPAIHRSGGFVVVRAGPALAVAGLLQ